MTQPTNARGIVILFVAVAMLVAWRGKPFQAGDTSESSRLARVLHKAPAAALDRVNPYPKQPQAAAGGAKLFHRYCATCHGAEAQGLGKAPDLRSGAIQQAPPGVLFWFLSNGNLRRGMPAWSGLPDQQRWQLVSYLQSLGERSGATDGEARNAAQPPER